MNRFLFPLLFVFVPLFSFASGSMEYYGGLPFYEVREVQGSGASMGIASFSLGYGSTAFLRPQDRVGFAAYGSFILPRENIPISRQSSGIYSADSSDVSFGYDALLGAVFHLYRSERLVIPLSTGIHFASLQMDNPVAESLSVYFGLGLSLGAEFHINGRFYLFARVQESFDFFETSKRTLLVSPGTTKREESFRFTWGVQHIIGVGITL